MHFQQTKSMQDSQKWVIGVSGCRAHWYDIAQRYKYCMGEYTICYTMSKISNRIKRYAIKNFDTHLDESLFLSTLCQKQVKQPSIEEDNDIKLRQAHAKFVYYQKQPLPQNIDSQNDNFDTEPEINEVQQQAVDQKDQSITLKTPKNSKNSKLKYKNFIELTDYKRFQSEKNIALDHKIQKMRNGKLQPGDKDNKRQFFSTYKETNQNKDALYSSMHLKKNDGNVRRGRQNGNGYIPIGYNGQRLQKKVSKISDLAKYNTHFIDMEISVDAGVVLVGSDGKENNQKKEPANYNIFQKTRQNKCNQILNSKNVYHAVFRALPKKSSEEEKKLEFERKLQNFANNYENERVQLTLRQLMQFKQIVYRRREEEYFLAQQEVSHHLKSHKELTEESRDKHIVSCKNNVIKKEEVNIQNLKNYEDLIGAAEPHQEFNKSSHRKGEMKRPKAEVCFQQKRSLSRKAISSHHSFHFRTKTTRKQLTHRRDDSLDI